jgi:LmbE family N-acetylglucosaminyl deacetylase
VLSLTFDTGATPLRRVLCLGAHCDDIEIGCSGTILKLLSRHRSLAFQWVVFSSDEKRKNEAVTSAEIILRGASSKTISIKAFKESFFPYVGAEIKDDFEQLKRNFSPDLIFTHYRNDLHQDHRVISELTWNTFRDHFILEYEIPKYDGDLGTPNFFSPILENTCNEKVKTILDSFSTQSDKQWFSAETFYALMRLRGIECNAPSGYAEAFYCRKAII